jgi:SAM-dependent methyltransferase
MSDWSHGYVTEIEYVLDFHGEQAPAHLDLTCLLNGIEPPARAGTKTYCELGCGGGLNTLLLAAANPGIAFWGIDFNPAHIARARALQAEYDIGNVTFLELGFDALTGAGAPDLPAFDYVAMHGVYSWIAADLRAAIVRFLADRVTPGGLVYVSHNTMPGWAATVPLQHLIREIAQRDPDRIDRAVVRAIDVARQVAAAGSPYVNRGWLGTIDELVAAGRTIYLAHEYANEHWTPRYHHEVAEELAAAKLAYAGSATLLENFAQLCLTAEQIRLRDVAGPRLRETMLDYFLQRRHRRDVYVRGARRLSAARHDALLRQVRLAATVAPDEARYSFDLPIGQTEFPQPLYAALFAALAQGAASVGELLDLPAARDHGKASAVELAGILVGTDQALPLTAPPDAAARTAAKRINALLLAHMLNSRPTAVRVVAPAAGTALRLAFHEVLVYRHLLSGAATDDGAVIAAIAREAAEHNIALQTEDGAAIPAGETEKILRQTVDRIVRSKVPLWRTLGLL